MKVAELFAYLGIVSDEKKAKDFFNILESGKQVMFGLAAAAVGTSLSIGAMLNKAVQTSLALAHFEAETGLSAQTLQEWQHVGEGLGLTVDEVTSSIAGLNDQLAEVKLTGQGAAPYSRLGLNPLEMENAWDVLEQLRKIIKAGDVPPQLMSKLIKQMGLSGAMVKVLKLTNKEFEEMANRGAIITDDQIEKALKFNASMRKIGQTITYLFTVAFAELQPGIMELLKGLIGWLEENKENIQKAIVGIAKLWQTLAEDMGKTFAIVDKWIIKIGGWEKAFTALGLAMLALKPGLLVIAGIAEAIQTIDYFLTAKGTAFEKFDRYMRGKAPGLWISKYLTGPGFRLGEMLGKRYQAGITPTGREARPGLGLGASGLLGLGAIPGMMQPAGGPTTYTTTIYVQSNATDNEEVARIVTDTIEKDRSKAAAGIP